MKSKDKKSEFPCPLPAMPLYSTKNVHRADFDVRQEQLDWEENDEDYRKDIYNMMEIIDSYTECGDRTHWYDSVYDLFSFRDYSAFDDYWVHEIHNPVRARSWRRLKRWCWRCNTYGCRCSFKYCSCDMCYEYTTTRDRKKLIAKYFSPEQILETLQDHLRTKNCWGCARMKGSLVSKREVTRYLCRRSSSDVFIPQTLEMDCLPLCVVSILDTQFGQEVKELHAQREHNEKCVLLAKYGLTLEDYEASRVKQPIQEESQEKPQEINKPKQKFSVPKESALQVGEFV